MSMTACVPHQYICGTAQQMCHEILLLCWHAFECMYQMSSNEGRACFTMAHHP